MDIPDHLRPRLFPVNVRVVVPLLPEVRLIAFELPRTHLLQRLEKLRNKNLGRLVHQQVHMLRHQHIRINPRLMPSSRFFQQRLNGILRVRQIQQRKPLKATERDEVQRPGLLEPLQACGHKVMLILQPHAMQRRRSPRPTESVPHSSQLHRDEWEGNPSPATKIRAIPPPTKRRGSAFCRFRTRRGSQSYHDIVRRPAHRDTPAMNGAQLVVSQWPSHRLKSANPLTQPRGRFSSRRFYGLPREHFHAMPRFHLFT